MTFLEAARSHLCHEQITLVPNPHGFPSIRCNQCGNVPIPNVYEWINSMSKSTLTGASHMAQLYFEWSGDVNVPVPFVVVNIEGILAKRIEGQSLYRLQRCIKILKALNAPFTQLNAPAEKPTEEMQNFMADFVSIIESIKYDTELKPSEKSTLNHVLKSMHGVLQSKEFEDNKFDFYSKKLVSYVKSCHPEWTLLPPDDHDDNVASQLLKQLQRSQAIRKQFGKYSIPFDIFHVLVGCYACSTDVNVMTNWALDFIMRICKGKFFWKEYAECDFVKQYRAIMMKYFEYRRNPSRNMEFYYLVKSMARGEGMECLSENFFKYGQLEQFFRDKIQVGPDMKDMVISQLFPAVVFENQMDHMAFIIALGHVATNFDKTTCLPRKGAFSKARKISAVVKTLMTAALNFDSQQPLPWTIDTLKLFMLSDPKIEECVQMLGEVVLSPNEDDE